MALPNKFSSPRPGQEDVITDIGSKLIAKEQSRVVLNAGTGTGKTYLGWGISDLLRDMGEETRSIALTATRGLQQQEEKEFGFDAWGSDQGLALIEGKKNYRCTLYGNCEIGEEAGCTFKGCVLDKAIEKGAGASRVISNYHWWIANGKAARGRGVGGPVGEFDFAILDEAHSIPTVLMDSLAFNIGHAELDYLTRSKEEHKGFESWEVKEWSLLKEHVVDREIGTANENGDTGRAKKLQRWFGGLSDINVKNWVLDHRDGNTFFDIIYPGSFAESYLFQGVPRVLLQSASVRKKTCQWLGMKEGSYEFYKFPSPFDKRRSPVVLIPSIRYKGEPSPRELKQWANTIGLIINAYPKLRGIVHVSSFTRGKLLWDLLPEKMRSRLMLHEPKEKIHRFVERFYESPEGAIAISPSMTTGYDFADDKCRLNIIAKIPYPDLRSKVWKARLERDPGLGSFMAAQSFEQALGRPMRHPKDWCVNYIVDDMFWGYFNYWREKEYVDPGLKVEKVNMPLRLGSWAA